MTEHTWVGPPGDRQFATGRHVYYSLVGSAEEIITRLQRIVTDHPHLNPMDIRGNAMITVAPGITEIEAAGLQERAETQRREDADR
jgi:hypothetical protein